MIPNRPEANCIESGRVFVFCYLLRLGIWGCLWGGDKPGDSQRRGGTAGILLAEIIASDCRCAAIQAFTGAAWLSVMNGGGHILPAPVCCQPGEHSVFYSDTLVGTTLSSSGSLAEQISSN